MYVHDQVSEYYVVKFFSISRKQVDEFLVSWNFCIAG